MSQEDIFNFGKKKKQFTFNDIKLDTKLSERSIRKSINRCFKFGSISKIKQNKKTIYVFK